MKTTLLLTNKSTFRALENQCLEFFSHLKVITVTIFITFLSKTCIWVLHGDYNTNQVKQAYEIESSHLGTRDQKLRAITETKEKGTV